MRLSLSAALATLTLGCQASPLAPHREEPSVLIPFADDTSTPDAVMPAPPPDVDPGPTLTMKDVRFDEGDMQLSIIDAAHTTHAWDRGGVLTQTVPLVEDRALRIVVRAGVGESLDGFRRDHDEAELTDGESGTICDQPATRLVAHEPEQHITCVIYADGRPNSPAYIPAETSVVAAFQRGGLGVTAEWEIPTDMRAQYLTLEKRFFASLRCH
jgi:hypothetical protein